MTNTLEYFIQENKQLKARVKELEQKLGIESKDKPLVCTSKKTTLLYKECTPKQKELFKKLYAGVYKFDEAEHFENYLMVMTPKPYVVERWQGSKREHLDGRVAGLRKILGWLKISNSEAREKEYTLNYSTGEKLMKFIRQKEHHGLTREQLNYIYNYNW